MTISLPAHENQHVKTAKVIAVTSGKGGVGKTGLVINTGIALAQHGLKVFIIDADLGTANVDVLLNIQATYNLRHVVDRQKDILDIVVEGPGGIFLVPGGSGFQSLADMDTTQLQRVINSCKTLEAYADIIMIDTGAGLSKGVINFILAADQVVVVTTTEPHAITDAYAILKVTSEYQPRPRCGLVINRAETAGEARQVGERMAAVVRRFLQMDLDLLGFVPDDPTVSKAIKRQTPHILAFPNAPAAQGMRAISRRLWQPAEPEAGERSFFDRFRDLLTRGKDSHRPPRA
ncbi:hypothetical protein SY88_00915 [Clostridiales bacterium PH28_bin88]|nr:hypothetical protein SY88_00915 [Clostridiales bacterium PH28_bin88]